MIRSIFSAMPRPGMGFVKPFLELVYKAVLQFLRYWLDANLGTKILTSPVLIVALLFLGVYVFLFGCRV